MSLYLQFVISSQSVWKLIGCLAVTLGSFVVLWEMTWDDMRRHAMTWDDMRWHEATRDDTRWHEMTWGDTRWHEVTRDDMRWHEATWKTSLNLSVNNLSSTTQSTTTNWVTYSLHLIQMQWYPSPGGGGYTCFVQCKTPPPPTVFWARFLSLARSFWPQLNIFTHIFYPYFYPYFLSIFLPIFL